MIERATNASLQHVGRMQDSEMPQRTDADWKALEEAALDVINDVVRQPPDPPILYHYTTPEAARLIIESGHVWASNVRYMNDLSELRYAQEVIAKALTDYVVDVPDRVMAMVHITNKSLAKFIEANDFYVTSFSGHPDLLGQWRAYCSAGRGFALGFEGRAISGFSGEFNLFRVEYSRPAQEVAVRRIFDLYRPALVEAVEQGDAALTKAATQFGIRFAPSCECRDGGRRASQQVTVQVVGDTLDEPNETFNVVLSNPNANATIALSC